MDYGNTDNLQNDASIIAHRESIIRDVKKLLQEDNYEEIKARLVEYGYSNEEIPAIMGNENNIIAAFIKGDQAIGLPDTSNVVVSQPKENVQDNILREKYLPIGSIVLLKGGKKRAMITGFCSVAQENQDKIYDYSGCVYPEGYLSSNQVCLFDHDQIEKIFFVGYEDDEEKIFKGKLKQIVESLEADKRVENYGYSPEEIKPFAE